MSPPPTTAAPDLRPLTFDSRLLSAAMPLFPAQPRLHLPHPLGRLVQPPRRPLEALPRLRQLCRRDNQDHPHPRANHCQQHLHRQTSAPI